MKKRIRMLVLIALCTLVMCACQNTDSGENDVEEAERTEFDNTPEEKWEDDGKTDDNTESEKENEPQKTEETLEVDDGTGLSKPVVKSVKVVTQDSEEAKHLVANHESMDQWYTELKDMSVTFPSCQEFTDGLTIKTVATSDELINYVNTYSDVWSIKDDTLVVERTEFIYNHSWFYNQKLTSGDDGIHYYIIENPEFDMEYSYTLDGENVFFDEVSKTLYLSVVTNFNYEEYLKMSSSNKTIKKIKEEAQSNRMFVAINYPGEKINEVVFIMPRFIDSAND